MTNVKTGIYANFPNDKYHAGPGVSRSQLTDIMRSPAHYREKHILGGQENRTTALIVGSAVHCKVLEPEKYDLEYIVAGKIDRRTKDGKEQWAAHELAAAGKEVLTLEQGAMIESVAAAVAAHPMASALLSKGRAEMSAYWTDEATGELCRCRPDFITDSGLLLDLKTTEDASPEGFLKSIFKYGYHRQPPWYLDGTNAAGAEVSAFIYIAVEKTAPWAIGIYVATDEMNELGRYENAEALQLLHECKTKNDWPSYGNEIKELAMPYWASRKLEKYNDRD